MKPDYSKAFEELMDTVERSVKYCAWTQSHNVLEYLAYIQQETEEIKDAIAKGQVEAVKEEISDLLFNTHVLAKLAEGEYGADIPTLMRNIVEKVKRRKPNIYEGRIISPKEAIRIWNEAKQNETH